MTAGQIRKAFGYKLIGTKFMKERACEAISLLPDEIISFVTKKCWFVSSFDDGYAFTLRSGDLKKGEHLIFLSDELLNEDFQQIRYTILHEIGHVVLGHKNSIGEILNKPEVRRQEKETDEFAKEWL